MNSSTCSAVASRSMKVDTDGASSAVHELAQQRVDLRRVGRLAGRARELAQRSLETLLQRRTQREQRRLPLPASSTPSKPR